MKILNIGKPIWRWGLYWSRPHDPVNCVLTIGIQSIANHLWIQRFPDSKVHGTNMGTTWALPTPDGPHVGPMNLAIRYVSCRAASFVMQCVISWYVGPLCDGIQLYMWPECGYYYQQSQSWPKFFPQASLSFENSWTHVNGFIKNGHRDPAQSCHGSCINIKSLTL